MDLNNIKDIEELNDKLTSILNKEYVSEDTWAYVASCNIQYEFSEDEPYIDLIVKYGLKEGETNSLKLAIFEADINFICGQFFQAIMDKEQGVLDEE